MTILLVDDHADFRAGFRKVLGKLPFVGEILEAGDGAAAIRLAKEHSPDVIFMDISMPGVNGIEATRAIHQDQSEIKIIMLTVHAKSSLVNESFRAGASGFLSKKSANQELTAVMERIMSNERYISGEVSES